MPTCGQNLSKSNKKYFPPDYRLLRWTSFPIFLLSHRLRPVILGFLFVQCNYAFIDFLPTTPAHSRFGSLPDWWRESDLSRRFLRGTKISAVGFVRFKPLNRFFPNWNDLHKMLTRFRFLTDLETMPTRQLGDRQNSPLLCFFSTFIQFSLSKATYVLTKMSIWTWALTFWLL